MLLHVSRRRGMSIPVVVGTKKTIEECGYSEKWLEDQIANNLAILGLGEGLKVVYRQREQASGGRIDLLLEDIDYAVSSREEIRGPEVTAW
jgi:hypothetical protein